ncbi:Hsp20/alpha crystallin family protein [Rhodobacteraceae bacterium NNCM2]|nr:Hsp20/alpha crystallin family protein [Coraliihabitans acroporae]
MVESTSLSGLWPQVYEPFRMLGNRIADFFAPASEARSKDEGYVISLELPGVKQEDIHVSVEGNMLTVSGEKHTMREEKTDSVYFSERQFGAFKRSFRLPPDAVGTDINAEFTDGLLTVTVPRKVEPATKARKIEVRKT